MWWGNIQKPDSNSINVYFENVQILHFVLFLCNSEWSGHALIFSDKFKTLVSKRYTWFYIALYPFYRWTGLADLGLPIHSDTNLSSLGRIQPCCNLITVRRLFTHISTAVYSQVLVYKAEWIGASWRERKYPSFEKVAKGIRTKAISIAIPVFYHWATAAPNVRMHLIGQCERVRNFSVHAGPSSPTKVDPIHKSNHADFCCAASVHNISNIVQVSTTHQGPFKCYIMGFFLEIGYSPRP